MNIMCIVSLLGSADRNLIETGFEDRDEWIWSRVLWQALELVVLNLWVLLPASFSNWDFFVFRKLISLSLRSKHIPLAVQCGVEGCTNMKKYCCSQTGVQLCSLECYRKNIARIGGLCGGNFKL